MLEPLIKNYFYESLLNLLLDANDYNAQNIAEKIKFGVVLCIYKILEESRESKDIVVQGNKITKDNCPEIYKPLFLGLIALKHARNLTDEMVNALADKIIATDSFKEMNPSKVLLGIDDAAPEAVVIPEKKSKQDPELIRETFYNEMAFQGEEAIKEEWFTRDDLEEQESKLYFALPALTLIAAIEASRECKIGIRLLKHELFTEENCPQVGIFPMLLTTLLKLKPAILQLTSEQLQVVKESLASDKNLKPEQDHIRKELSDLIGSINRMAMQISNQPVFHKMVVDVFTACLERTQPSMQPK